MLDREQQITSKYKAYPPEGVGGPPKVVKLTAVAKRRYERLGWRFERTTLPTSDSY